MALSIFSLMGSIFVDSSEAEKSISDTEKKSSKLSESFSTGLATAGKWAAGIAAGAGAAALALGGAALSVATDVDSAMNGFAAATGTAVEELGKYEDAMLNIYNNNFGESFEDIANSMGEVKKIMGEGMGAEELENMTTNALMLRDTFDFDVTESVRAANSLMDQFGITGDEAYNLIAQGAQNGLNQNGDLLDVLNEYSVQFSGLGYSAEDMFNMIANGAESGTWSVDKLGDAAKEFNIRISDGTADEALQKLGFNVDDVNAKYAQGGEMAQGATTDIITALKSVENENERYMLGQELMGTMWEDLGEDAIYALLDTQGEISNTKDVLTDINNVKYDDIGSMVEGLKRNFETLALPIGNALIPLIQQLLQMVMDNMPLIENLVSQFTPIVIELFNTLLPPIMNLINLLLPVLMDLINALLPPFMDIINLLLPVLMDLINTLLPPIMEIVNMILPLLLDLIEPIMGLLQPIIDALKPLIDLVMAVIKPLLQLLDIVLPPLIKVITFLIEQVLLRLQAVFQSVSNAVSNVVNVLVKSVKEQIETLKKIFSQVIDFVKNVFTGNWKAAFENVKNILSNIFKGMLNVVKTPINAIIGVINGLVSGVVSGVNGVISTLNKFKINVPSWVTELTGVKNFGFNLSKISAPKIPYLAEGGTAIEAGSAVVGEAGAELIDLPKGAKVTPLTENGDPIGYKEVASKLDVMISLLSAILEKEGVVQIGETQFVNYVNKTLGALI